MRLVPNQDPVKLQEFTIYLLNFTKSVKVMYTLHYGYGVVIPLGSKAINAAKAVSSIWQKHFYARGVNSVVVDFVKQLSSGMMV